MIDVLSTNFTIEAGFMHQKNDYDDYYTRSIEYIPRKSEKTCDIMKFYR